MTTSRSLPAPDWAATEQLLHTLCTPDQVVELRALNVAHGNHRPYTRSGFYDYAHLGALVADASQLTPHAQGVYISLNPIHPALLARRMNRVAFAGSGDCAKDADVLARRWLLLDIDPVRPSGISATDAEKELAYATALQVLAFLTERGWPAPVVCDSGNGFHLLHRIDLPVADDRLVERVLRTLAQRFDTTHAKIDTAVGNACRHFRLPGTLARKGDSTPDRPHRRSAILEQPATLAIVTREQLLSLIQPATATGPPTVPTSTPLNPRPDRAASRGILDVGRWLHDHGYQYRVKDQPDARGRTVYCLEHCPFNSQHTNQDAAIFVSPDGKLGAKCLHQSCQGLGWREFKARIGKPRPEHYHAHPTTPNQGTNTVDPQAATTATDTATLEVIIDPVNRTTQAVTQDITEVLVRRGDCFQRANRLVVCREHRLTTILGTDDLTGLLHENNEVIHVTAAGSRKYRPLPPLYASLWLKQPHELQRFPAIELFTANPVFTPAWTLTRSGYDSTSGIYYAGATITPRTGTTHLDHLLAEFCFRSPSDRANYLGFLLTIVLLPHFLGSKPALLLNGNQPGLGKSILAQLLAILRDGQHAPTISYNPNDEEFEKRLGAVVHAGMTTLIVDNARGTKRQPEISSPCLERSITDPIVSFRLLGASTSIRVENSLTFCITANSAQVSHDLLTRTVVVHLEYQGDPAARTFRLVDPEEYARQHRTELLGELLGLVQRWLDAGRPEATTPSRFNKKGWGRIVGGILQVAGYREFLAQAASDAVELDPQRQAFYVFLTRLAQRSESSWTATDLARLAQNDKALGPLLGPAEPHGQATRMGQLASIYVGMRVTTSDGTTLVWLQRGERKGKAYVFVSVPDVACMEAASQARANGHRRSISLPK